MSTSACAPMLGPAELYPRLQSFVRGVLRALGTAPGDLDDLTQDVFVTMHRKGCTFDHERAARAWLYGTARRIASNDRRARRRAARREPGWSVAEATSPEAHAQRRQAARRVRRFADELDAPLREVFVRSELGGASAPEIAEDLGLNLNTTYSHIRRIRRRLARQLIVAAVLVVAAVAMLQTTCAVEARNDGEPVAVLRGSDVATHAAPGR